MNDSEKLKEIYNIVQQGKLEIDEPKCLGAIEALEMIEKLVMV